ncbi:transcription/translation regulatory transformer protein RfaH [Aliidiomarina indica]|uniref:transcription/translation regulatory transformer protein RfaH n=1 Tax=Aliidiomarina indica TaxID=2749147 RepID=UPI00188FC00E|nr:transcription/translation regulatory transformer protein RfaH [Aliidiomarina indica]
MESWYLLHCKARETERAEWHLANQGFSTFCPRTKITKRLRGKRKTVIEPLFPNYLFIQLDIGQENYTALRSTRGVNGFVRFGGYPSVVPDNVVESLRERSVTETSDGAVGESPSLYKAGTVVEIVQGPFAGLKAVYEMPDGEERCFVLLDMLGKQQRINIEEVEISA